MEERVIVDLAMIPDNSQFCPVCGNELSISIAPYRYIKDGTTRTSYAGLLFCEKCNEFFGSQERLDRIRASIMRGKAKKAPIIDFPSHLLDQILLDNSHQNMFSLYEIREKKNSAVSQTNMSWTVSINSSLPTEHSPIRSDSPKAETTSTTTSTDPPKNRGSVAKKRLLPRLLGLPKPPVWRDDADVKKKGKDVDANQKTNPAKATLPIAGKRELSSFSGLVRYYDAPKSTVLVIQYQDVEDNQEPFLFIVANRDDHDGTRSFYHVSSAVGNRVMEAVLRGNRFFSLNGNTYNILHKFDGPDFSTVAKPRTKVLQLVEKPEKLVDVYVYNLHGLCRLHGKKTEKLIVNMVSSRSPDPHPLEVYYCPVCGKFYVNYETYFSFYRKYGIPPLKLFGDSEVGESGKPFSSLRDKSDLYLFGYSVSGELADNPDLRQAILEDIIDSGNLTKAQVTSHLEWLIRFGKHNDKMQYAISRWKNDLRHIEQYKPRRTNIWGRFKSSETNVFL